MEGFSIREYASRMRIVDVVKCWPFDDTIDEETVKSLLPPITIKKFTWWFDEIERFDSKSAEENINSSKNKKKLTQEASDLNMKIAKMKSIKGKGKAPKKRSIVELFAVAPQVEKVISNDEDEDEDEDEEEEEKEVEEEDGFFNSNSSNEEINWGVKGKRNSKKKNKDKDILLSELKKTKKLIKKPKTKNKNVDLSCAPNKENHFKLKLQFQDKAIGNPSSSHSKESENDILDPSSITNLKHSDTHKITMTCGDFNSIADNENPRLLGCGILNNHATESSIEQQPAQCCLLQETVNENQRGKQKADDHILFSENDDILSIIRKRSQSVDCFKFQKDYAQGVEKGSSIVQTSGNEDFSNTFQNEVDFGVCDPRTPPVSFKDYLGTYDSLQQAKDTGQASTSINHLHPFHCEPYPYLAPEELLQSLFSLTRRNHSRNICEERIYNGVEKHFVGLPLNSHGEFNASNSSSKSGVNQTMNLEDHSDPFLVEHYMKENPLRVIPSRRNFSSQLQSNRIDMELDLLKISDCSFSMGKEDKKVESSQSTMRLMGKEFQVGGRGFQGLDEDKRIWKDKRVTDHELRSGNISINESNEPYLGRLVETSFCPSEFTINPRLESRFTAPHFGFRTGLMHQNGFGTREFDEAQNLFPMTPPSAYIAEYESFIEPSNATASYHVSRPHVSPSAVPRPASFRFPFMHPDIEGTHVQSWRPSMSNRFDVTEKEIVISDSYWNLGNSYHPSAVIENESSMSFRPQAFCVQRPVGPTCPVQSHYALTPSYPRFLPLSAAQERHLRNQKRTRERINMGVTGRNNGKKAKRQNPSVPNVPFKPVWLRGHQSPQFDNYEHGAQSNYERTFEHGTQIVAASIDPSNPFAETASGIRFLESENLERFHRF